MTATIPEWIAAQGNWNAYWLPAAGDLAAITVAEFEAGVDMTCYFPDPQWEGIGGEQEKGEQTRACLKESFEVLGRIKRSIADATYTVLPQALDTDDANKVATAVAVGSEGVLVTRRGKPADQPIEAGDKYSAIKAQAGLQKENMGGSDAFAPTTNTSSFSTSGALIKGTVVA